MIKLFVDRHTIKLSSQDIASVEGHVWYQPQHATKSSSKCRVVFDCAAKYKNVSLNDMLLKGPYDTD